MAILVAIIVILLLLLCNCGLGATKAVPGGPGGVEDSDTDVDTDTMVAAPPAPFTGRIDRRDRPEYPPAVPVPVPWLDAFRMQVSARSPRLARCFVGTEQPGRMKWTTSVVPAEGAVSEHDLEPVLATRELTAAERACVLEVLSEPAYTLIGADGPSRVSLVIEF